MIRIFAHEITRASGKMFFFWGQSGKKVLFVNVGANAGAYDFEHVFENLQRIFAGI